MNTYMFVENELKKYATIINENDYDFNSSCNLFASFHFYHFDTFFKFISSSFNFIHINSYIALKQWYEEGINNQYSFYLHWFINSKLYREIRFTSKCIYCNDSYTINPIDKIIFVCSHFGKNKLPLKYNFIFDSTNDVIGYNMCPLKHKIIVKYSRIYSNTMLDNGIKVEVIIPMLCNGCVYFDFLKKHHYHLEFYEHIKINQCRCIQTLDTFLLSEPYIKKKIMQYL